MKTGIYCRVSSEEQQERGTIQNQIEFAEKYCDLHKLEIVKWYKDDGVTGTIPLEDREEGRKLLKDAKDKKIDLLLIYKLDRLGRSARIILNSVYDLEQQAVKIRSMTEPFDTGDPNGRFLLTILAGVADLERETILERLWHGTNRAARQGKYLGGIVPYGYKVNKEGYLEISEDPLPEIDMSESDVVRLIFRLICEKGMSTMKIADYLNTLNIPTSYSKDGRKVKKGKRKVRTAGIWRPARVGSIIKNSTYKGLHCFGKRTKKDREIIERKVDAIVSEDIWEKAQQVLRENQLKSTKNSKNNYLLRGLIKCNICGLTYSGVSYKGKKSYYQCNGKNFYNGPKGKCASKNVPQPWIEELVWNECVNFINNPGEIIKELASTLEQKQKIKRNFEEEKNIARKALEDKDGEKQEILDLYRRKIISVSDVEIQLQKISKEIAFLKSRITELENNIRSEDNDEKVILSAEELLNSLRLTIQGEISFEEKREIVKSLVEKIEVITVTENERLKAKVHVHFRFVKIVNDTGVLAVFWGIHDGNANAPNGKYDAIA